MDIVSFYWGLYAGGKNFYGNFAAVPFCVLQLPFSISLFFPKPLTDGDIHRSEKTGDMAKKRICAGYVSVLRRGKTC